MTEATVSTYARVAELERAGMSRSAAFERVADLEGVSKGAVSQRYYVARKGSESAPARPRARKTGATAPVVDGADLGTLIETAALMVLEAVKHVRDLERDAERWREVAEIAQR